jgi:hypothetical protein
MLGHRRGRFKWRVKKSRIAEEYKQKGNA